VPVNKNAIRVGVSLVLMVILLVVFLRNVDFAEVARAVEQANPWLILASVATALLSYWVRTVRWQLILRPVGRVRHINALIAVAVGYAAMTLLPARMGDLVRPIVLSRREKVPLSGTLASMVTERLFDLWTVVLFFLIFVIWPPPMSNLTAEARRNLEILNLSGYVAGAGLIVGTMVLLALFRFQVRFVELITRPVGKIRAGWKQPLTNFLNHFLDGLRVIERPKDLLITLGASILVWYIIYWQVRFCLLAFGLDLPLRAAFLLVTLSVIGLVIPTPGGIGAMHKAIQFGLTAFFAVGLNEATAIALVYHAICFVPITIIGLLCLPLVGLRLGEVSTLAAEEKEQS